MKLLSQIKKMIFILICTSLIFNCTQNAENKINNGIELYTNGETAKATAYLEEGIIDLAIVKKLNGNHLSYGENIIFYRKKNTLKTIWPLELNIDVSENYNIISYDPDTKKLGLCNGYDIKIYDAEGSLIKTCGPTPDEQRIKAFIIIREKIYYYKDKKIFSYDLGSDTIKLLTSDKFTAAFGNEAYNVRFFKTENLLAAAIGIAGKYYFNILDLRNNIMVLQDLTLASSKLSFQDNDFYYISGEAGKYILVKQTIIPKKTKNLFELGNLADVELFSSGLLFEDKEGFRVIDYEKAFNLKTPFHFEVTGQCGGRPVIKYSNNYYLIDMAVFLDRITSIKNKIPAIFEDAVKK